MQNVDDEKCKAFNMKSKKGTLPKKLYLFIKMNWHVKIK